MTMRQHHNCNACRQFIERFGSLVVVKADGTVKSALWDESDAYGPYTLPVLAMRNLVESGRITGVFLSNEKVFGTPKTGKWTHLSVVNPARFSHPIDSAYQAMAQKRQDYGMVTMALSDFNARVVGVALELLTSESLYRSEKVLGPVSWFAGLQRQIALTTGFQRNHLVWRAVAAAPTGFAHIRSSVAGSLLEDIAAGKPTDEVRRAFAAKMDPTQYRRPTAAPKAGTIAAAEKAFADMGLARSLERRFARLDEIAAVWMSPCIGVPPAGGVNSPYPAPGLFAHLEPKKRTEPPKLKLPGSKMTWDKFRRTVLPEAESVEVYVKVRDNFCAMLTAVHPDAPPILQWDRDEHRNPVSWYVYQSGSLATNWKIRSGEFAKVNAITLKPSMWHGGMNHQGKGVVLVIDGAVDQRDAGNGLFPEIMRSELHPYRAVIEAYSRGATLGGRPQASACGILLADGAQGTWNTTLRVTTATSVREIVLDRWD
jgi:hypothetical protein